MFSPFEPSCFSRTKCLSPFSHLLICNCLSPPNPPGSPWGQDCVLFFQEGFSRPVLRLPWGFNSSDPGSIIRLGISLYTCFSLCLNTLCPNAWHVVGRCPFCPGGPEPSLVLKIKFSQLQFWIYPGKLTPNTCMNIHAHKHVHVCMFVAAKGWQWLTCPSANEWINTMCCIRTMQDYLAIKSNDVLIHATMSVYLKTLC